MWTLRSSPASPFGRKVAMAAAVCGLTDRIDVQAADTADAADPLRRQNPLGKIPTLILDDGTALYDSRVICEYFDRESGGAIIPAGAQRFAVLTLQALADGIMDAAVLQVYEKRWRAAEIQSRPWTDHQAGKIDRALAAIAAAPPSLDGRPDVGQIALACALGYLDLRFGSDWRTSHPPMAAWLDDFARNVPSFADTRPPS